MASEMGTLTIQAPAKQEKKRVAKPGTRRVTVALTEAEYKALVEAAANEMREPNNMLSFVLKGQIGELLEEYLKQ